MGLMDALVTLLILRPLAPSLMVKKMKAKGITLNGWNSALINVDSRQLD